MDQSQYSSLLEVLAIIPDPRKARGKRYAWTLLLTLLPIVETNAALLETLWGASAEALVQFLTQGCQERSATINQQNQAVRSARP
jgi:hypothetical protein